MLKIIPTPEDCPGVISTFFPENEKYWENVFGEFNYGIYFEYWDDAIINFRFFYTPETGISILEGPWSSEYIGKGNLLKGFFDYWIDTSELEKWLDEVPFKVVKALPYDDPGIKEIWKMETNFYYHKLDTSPMYYEFMVSTTTVRCMPYNCWTNRLKFDVSDEKNKLYWITLCLLKYLKQSKQQLGESMNL